MYVFKKKMSEAETDKILHLLRTTDISIPNLAKRFGVSRSHIAKLNQDHQVRSYSGKLKFTLMEDSDWLELQEPVGIDDHLQTKEKENEISCITDNETTAKS